MKKTYKIAFPVYATGYDIVDIDEAELKGKTKNEIKELLLSKSSSPSVCHQCSDVVEEIECDHDHLGPNLENVSFWQEDE